MAVLLKAKTDAEIKAMSIADTRKAYSSLALEYDRITNPDVKKYLYCHHCNKFVSSSNFYTDEDNESGYFYICKNCVQMMVEQRKTTRDEPRETKDSVQFVLRLMNRPYIDELYDSCVKSAIDNTKEKARFSPFASYIPMIKTLNQYKDLRWDDSQFGDDKKVNVVVTEEAKENVKLLNKARKRFGNMSDDDLIFLENEYEDWVGRYECQTKAQEEIFERICFNKLDAAKARREGKPTKDIDKSLQDLLATQNIQPRQNAGSMDAMSDAQTFGTLIQKWENTRPIPEVDDDLKDVDKIGLYIDAFYRGHMSKMLNIPNNFTHIYEKVMDKYTVKKPEYDQEDEDTNEILFDKIFSNIEDY